MGTVAYGEAVSWTPIQEDTLFTEGGLKYIADLAEIPENVQTLEGSPNQGDGVDIDFKSTHFCADETAKELQGLFASQTSSYARYFHYRQSALEQLWLKREELRNSTTKCEQTLTKDHPQTAAVVGKRQIDFSSRVSLLLLIPLIKSHSKTDPSLAEHSTQVLFQCLKECLPNSLGNEPLSCVTGLADLLTEWLMNELEDASVLDSNNGETSCETGQIRKGPRRGVVQSETVVGCLLSLACARLSLRLFVRTLLMIQRTKEKLGPLPLANVLASTVQYEKKGWRNGPSIVLASNLHNTWQYSVPHAGCIKGNVISSDGHFLYITHGSCLIKLGSGKHGTLRGHVYCCNTNLPDGFMCYVKGKLIYRPKCAEKTYQQFADVIDTETLKVSSVLEYTPNEPCSDDGSILKRKTVNIISDGVLMYWLYFHEVPTSQPTRSSTSGSNVSQVVDIFMEVLEMKQSEDKYIVMSIQEPVVLKYKQEPVNNDFPMPLAMRPVAVSHQTQDDNSKTSCGLTVNILHRTPMFTDGTYIIMLIGHPNYQGYPVCKAPFNRCYSIVDGKFVRDDNLIDVSTAENPRWQSVSLASTGICYDMINNCIWTSSEDWVDEWLNIGASSYHHVVYKLSPKPRDHVDDDNEMMTPSDCMTVTALQVSFLCAAVSSDDLNSKDPSYDFTLDQDYQRHLLEIMDGAIQQQDRQVLHCVLILVQTLFFKAFQNNVKLNNDIVASVRLLIWRVISSDTAEFDEKVQEQACHTLRSGLGIFYPSLTEQSAVMMILLNEPEENGIPYLKDVLLRDFAATLRVGRPSGTGCVGW